MSTISAASIYPAASPYFPFPSRRSVVHSTNGIVACSQPLAAQAGLEILRKGGNCADAAVAVAATLNLTEPASTGIGGDMFCLFFNATTKKVHALNGSGRAPQKATLKLVREALGLKDGQLGELPMSSVHAVTVPGAAAGWVDTVEKFGSGNVTLAEVLEPAIRLAKEGFPVGETTAKFWGVAAERLKRTSEGGIELLKKDSKAQGGYRAPKAGEIFRSRTLARTFETLATEGKKGFYEGWIAEEIVKAVSAKGGFLSLEDLKHHGEVGTEEVDPLSIRFKGQNVGQQDAAGSMSESHLQDEHGGVEVWECPPNGQGIVALVALALLEELEKQNKIPVFSAADHNSAEYLHAVISSLALAFSAATKVISDPSHHTSADFSQLLSPQSISELAARYNPSATPKLPGEIELPKSDTVQFSVTDPQGNGISFINSLYGGFGTAVVPTGTGFALQCRGAGFSLEEGHANCFHGGKRPYHTIIPCLITNPPIPERNQQRSLHTVFGVMGGFMQPQGHVQVLLNLLAFKFHPQAALDAPRVCIGARPEEGAYALGKCVFVEDGIPEAVYNKLKELGHDVQVMKDWQRGTFGRGQVIRVHYEEVEEGEHMIVYSGGSDPRADGCAVGW